MTTEQDEAALRIAQEVDCLPMQSRDQWAKEFARRLLAWERERTEPVAWATNGYGKISLYWRDGINIDFIPNGTTIGLYAGPAAQDALDASFIRWLERVAPATLMMWRETYQASQDTALRAKEEG